jgi:hypothetical protein
VSTNFTIWAGKKMNGRKRSPQRVFEILRKGKTVFQICNIRGGIFVSGGFFSEKNGRKTYLCR